MMTTIAITESKAHTMRERDPTLEVEKYSAGKFKWKGSQKAHIDAWNADGGGQTPDDVVAIFFRRGSDAHGPYAVAMCLTTPVERPVERRNAA